MSSGVDSRKFKTPSKEEVDYITTQRAIFKAYLAQTPPVEKVSTLADIVYFMRIGYVLHTNGINGYLLLTRKYPSHTETRRIEIGSYNPYIAFEFIQQYRTDETYRMDKRVYRRVRHFEQIATGEKNHWYEQWVICENVSDVTNTKKA